MLFTTFYSFQYIASHIRGINLIQISRGQPDYLLSTCNATSAPVFGHHYCQQLCPQMVLGNMQTHSVEHIYQICFSESATNSKQRAYS